jgi:anaphase-promoting complex subunit 2
MMEVEQQQHSALAVSSRVLSHFERDLKGEISKGLWNPICREEQARGDDDDDDDDVLLHTLQQCEHVRSGLTCRLESSLSQAFPESVDQKHKSLSCDILRESRSVIYSVVSTTAPSTLRSFVSRYYRFAFSRYVEACELHGETGGTEDFPLDYEGGVAEVMGQDWCSRLAFVGQTLNALGLRSMNENIYTDMVFSHLKDWLEERAAGEYTRECLFIAQTYNRKVILEFLRLLLVSDSDKEENESSSLTQWRSRLDYFIYEILGQLRSDEMFDIVVDFPESNQALKDLKVCLEHTNVTDTFIDKFSGQLRRRLLHLGAATPVILAQYISSIKALNILDPSGILAEIICPLVKNYIKKRKDTTRCIVNMVVYDENLLSLKNEEEDEEEEEEEEEEGMMEEGSGSGGTVAGGYGGYGEGRQGGRDTDNDNDEDLEDIDIVLREMQWNPVPIQAAQLFSHTLKICNRDIVTALMDVLGNKEYFIKEYKMILAERLLAKVDDDIDDETRILELLKLRFGANSLRECEVMLKDMADSKRITSNIRALVQQQQNPNPNSAFVSDFSTVIVSELFWPPLFEGQVETPKTVQWMLDTFGAQYKALKAPRTLHWKPHLGVVDLELAFGPNNEIKEFTVSVAQALVISQFETKAQWEAGQLAEAAGFANQDQLSEKASIWVNSGILTKMVDKQSKKVIYSLVEDVSRQVEKRYAHTKPDVSVMSQEQQMEMNMKVYESYVMGMVTNLESLPLEKIHNMLKMFVLEPVYDKTIEELEAFLAKLVNDGKLTFDGLVYRKKKK